MNRTQLVLPTAAACLALVVSGCTDSSVAGRAPAQPSPSGASASRAEPRAPVDPAPAPWVGASDAVWYDAAGLHHGDVVQQTAVELIVPDPRRDSMRVLALVRSGALYRDPMTDDVWFHPWDAQPRIVGHGSPTGPGGDPQGDVAAWFEGPELVVYDTARGREVSRTDGLPVIDEYASSEHVDDGNGFLHVSNEEVVWRTTDYASGLENLVGRLDPGTGSFSILWGAQLDDGGPSDPQYFANPNLTDVHETTQVWADFENPTPLRVDIAGKEPLPLPHVEAVGKLNAGGSFLLAPTDKVSHGAAIVNVRTGETWNLGEGDDGFYAWISWAYGNIAVVEADHDGAASGPRPLLVCDAVKRECETLTTQGQVVLPTS